MKTTRTLTLLLALALLALVLLALSAPTVRAADPVVVRVTTSGTTTWPCGDQSNWSNPCALQTALSNTVSGSELWVAAGTYTPTMGVTRTATFHLVDGIALYGGFAMTETLRSQRNFTTNMTILSGDIGTPGDTSDNAYHVVTGSGVTNTAVIDGFTVTGGNADSYVDPHGYGGGMYCDGGGPALANVTFINNTATYDGGGMYNYNSNPTLRNVTFLANSADTGGGMYNSYSSPTLANVTFSGNSAPYGRGGGMFNEGASPTLNNVAFSSNSAGGGGGMYNIGGRPTLTNVTFSSNSATYDGGGIANLMSGPTLMNVTFLGNTASGNGGGIANLFLGGVELRNVTFIGNTAYWGGGISTYRSGAVLTNTTFISNTASFYGGGMSSSRESILTLTNVTLHSNFAGTSGGGLEFEPSGGATIRNAILWGNTAPNGSEISNGVVARINDSVVQGGCPAGSTTCTHVITADPRLGTFGDWGGSTQTIPLLFGSSAIDAGNDAVCPPTDQRGVPRPQGAHCDIGAFEAQFPRLNLPLISR